jgi:DNA mismatch repair protein MutS
MPLRHEVRKALAEISDMERLISRISLELGNARDLVALKTSLKKLPDLYQTLQDAKAPLLRSFLKHWDSLEAVALCIDKAIQESPPVSVKDGGLIRDGFHEGLDELRTVAREGKNWIAQMEREERKRSGIESLKVRYNQVFGYYIEVTKSHLSKVPPDFIRKQTLVNAERFFTPKLKELEGKVLGAEEKIQALELDLFQDIRRKVVQETSRVQAMAQVVAQIDVLSSLGEAANRNHYVKPVVTLERVIDIADGRHPVLEQFISDRGFVPNDTYLDGEGHRLLIITGPNMAGKSTYMRQVALIAIMAQMGSFVPAKSATIGMVDRIFTRVGASDNLVAGQSTFMLEMNETANILHNATPRSLILLDEVGRGTSTFDGLSIAWAVAEHILKAPNLGARTLFATHYHELMDLAVTHSGVQNYNSLVREWNEEIIFLRKIKAGGSDKSYGIQVARLAGLPQGVIQRAKEILENLEKGEIQFQGRLHHQQKNEETLVPQKDLFNEDMDTTFERESFSRLMEAFQQIDVLKMTPLQALNKLDELKKMVQTTVPSEQKEVK